ncbi:hypothetical protein O7602_15770 [Micromonospora sp. WMMD1128]|uniref:hypothetical protein n=1 Tax=unclassified Micromonospora TaxID=2617518 RepID=UPI00248D2C8C|nr:MULTISPECIES: hypothetical protein [unclassified Micromonospora]WBB71220.1 hypothetical protein O7602_15770 [Micromonospora sp. WMMD1128]WFE35310.1 hypothetical protein O7613_08005 [Micromonospora sp. WMMD975]
MGRKGTLILLAGAVVVGLVSLVMAMLDPSRVGSWATALGMACVASAQVLRLRELRKRGR